MSDDAAKTVIGGDIEAQADPEKNKHKDSNIMDFFISIHTQRGIDIY